MSIFQTIKDESKRNFIARADEAKDDIIYKYPEHNIRMMTQLTVASDEVALFVAEVFFVSVREFPGIKFGGPIGDVRDPETGLGIGTMVYGDFSIRVTEPERLVVGLVGMRSAGNEEF